MKQEDKIVVIMQRLALAGRNAVDIQPDQRRDSGPRKLDPRLFQRLPSCRVLDGLIANLHVSPRKQPAIEPPVVDQQYGFAFGVKDQGRGGDMARGELSTRQRRRGVLKKIDDQLLTLSRREVRGV